VKYSRKGNNMNESKHKETMNWLKTKITKAIDKDNERAIWSASLTLLEFLVRKSATKVDDLFVLPLIHILRSRLKLHK